MNHFITIDLKRTHLPLILSKWVRSGIFSGLCLLLILGSYQTAEAQCSAIASIDFAANNPDDPNAYWGTGGNDDVLESLEPQDYECFDVVPFLVELRIAPDAQCSDYVVELPLQWLCNTTGQAGIGVNELVDFQINPASDPGSANLDGDEDITLAILPGDNPETTGTPLQTKPCTFDVTFLISGLDPGDVVIVRVDVRLNCDLASSPTGNIQATLGTFAPIRIVSGTGSGCGCDKLQGGAQTIPWKVSLPECEIDCSITKNNDVSCNGFSDGSATVNVVGAFGQVTYAWSTGDNTATVDDLPAGTHTVTVSDEIPDCESVCMVTINEPPPLSINCEATPVTCDDDNGTSDDGTVDLTIDSDGAGGLTYAWSNGATTQDISGLAAGDYTVTVTDANGCTAVCMATVEEADPLRVSCEATPVTCDDDNGTSDDGTVDLTIDSDGAGGFTYAWSNGATTQDISGLAAGDYTVTVTDANGCTAVCMATVEEADPLRVSCEATPVTCDDDNGTSDDGTVDLTIDSDGAGGLTYAWSNGATTQDISGLAAGDYTVTVTDANGCTAVCMETVEEADPLRISCEATPVTCDDDNGSSDDGAVNLTIDSDGAGGLTYAWSNGATTQDISGLAAGDYTVTVTDANGCTAVCMETVEPASPLSCSITNNSGPSTICLEEELSLTGNPVGGVPPYDYAWSSNGTAQFSNPTSANTTVSNFSQGTETITLQITDANDCVSTCDIEITSEPCVEECTWTPGFWKNHPEEICGVLGGQVKRIKREKTCTGESGNIGFNLCGTQYTLSAEEISCLFDYASATRGGLDDLPTGCTPEVVTIGEHFAGFPNGETLLHHILAAKLNLIYNGADFGNILIGDLICIDEVNGINVPDIFNGTPNEAAGELCAINFCLDGATSASELSEYIEPLTAFNECNNTCGLPSKGGNSYISLPQTTVRPAEQELTLFPNPARDKLNIRFNLEQDIQVKIRVMDINGRLLQAREVEALQGWNTEVIDLKDLSNGLYLIQMTDGTHAQTKRFVKTGS